MARKRSPKPPPCYSSSFDAVITSFAQKGSRRSCAKVGQHLDKHAIGNIDCGFRYMARMGFDAESPFDRSFLCNGVASAPLLDRSRCYSNPLTTWYAGAGRRQTVGYMQELGSHLVSRDIRVRNLAALMSKLLLTRTGR